MIGVVLLTHEGLAETFLRTAHELGAYSLDRVQALSVRRWEPPEQIREKLVGALRIAGEAPVLVLLDQIGATHANIAMELSRQRAGVALAAGLNLPMLLRALDRRGVCPDADALARQAIDGGRHGLFDCNRRADHEASPPETQAADSPSPTPKEARRVELLVQNRLGLHAAAAAKLVHLANSFDADITLGLDDQQINAKSILGVLTLAAARGCRLTLQTTGADAHAAAAAMENLFNDRFGEGQ